MSGALLLAGLVALAPARAEDRTPDPPAAELVEALRKAGFAPAVEAYKATRDYAKTLASAEGVPPRPLNFDGNFLRDWEKDLLLARLRAVLSASLAPFEERDAEALRSEYLGLADRDHDAFVAARRWIRANRAAKLVDIPPGYSRYFTADENVAFAFGELLDDL